MKQKKKIKKKKKEGPLENEGLTPQSHEKVGNINVHSEEVAKGIVELLISLTISTNFKKKTQRKLYDFCFAEMERKIDDIIQLYNINHEVDDFNNSEYALSSINYLKTDTNYKRYKIDIHNKAKDQRNFGANRELFNLANINKIEQSEMIIKNKEIKDFLNKSVNEQNEIDLIRDDKVQFDIEITKYNYWGTITQPKSYFIDRTSSLYNNLKKYKNIFHKINTNQRKSQKQFFSSKKRYTTTFLKQKIKEPNEEEVPKKKFTPILQMSFVDLPKEEENKNTENEEIQNIRNETIQIFQAKKEKLKLLELSKKVKVKKETIKGKYTTDAEGKIVMIKEITPENLLKDFSPISAKMKELLTGKSIETLKKETALMVKKAKKNIIFNDSSGNTNINLFNQNLAINKETNKDNKNNANLSIEDPFSLFPLNLSKRHQRNEKIVLSGSNFKLMNPSPGVNIKEQNNIKQGGINFYQTFHKYSLDEFNRVLKDTLYLERAKLSGNFLNNNISPIKRDNTSKKEEKNFNMNFKAKKIPLQQLSERNKNNFRKTFSENFKPKKPIQKPLKEVFSLNEKNSILDLREALMHEDSDMIPSSNPNRKNKKLEKISSYNDIFRRVILTPNGRSDENKKEIKFNLMDNFNKDLIRGYYQTGTGRYVLPKLPPKTKINLNKMMNNINGMNNTMNNFYRTRQKRNNNELVQSLSSNSLAFNNAKI